MKWEAVYEWQNSAARMHLKKRPLSAAAKKHFDRSPRSHICTNSQKQLFLLCALAQKSGNSCFFVDKRKNIPSPLSKSPKMRQLAQKAL